MEEILILRGQNALGKQKIQFLLPSSSNVNINTVWKLKFYMYIKDSINKICWKNGKDLSDGAPKIKLWN